MKYGASTITQQLVKNAYLSNTKSLFRKMQELLLAFKVEGRLSKQEIMEWYLNIVEMSPGVYGMRAGSRYHFDKEPHELDFAEMVHLASILPAPTRFTRQPELHRERILR
jgi:membrane peptidoglycan carboxypeptidase